MLRRLTAKRLRLTSLKAEIPTTNTAIRPWITEVLNRGYAPLEEGSGMNPLWLTSILPAYLERGSEQVP